MRSVTNLAFLVLVGCHPSASIENTMPVANLQSFHSVGLRVTSKVFATQGRAQQLEADIGNRLKQTCGFDQIVPAANAKTEVVLDLTITAAGRGGGGMLSNPNLATLDALLVLSDGQSGELLGSARIHGQSSSVLINGASPEREAEEIVAKTIAEMLGKSGCSGPRIAKAPPPPPPGSGSATGSGTEPPPGHGSGTGSGSAPPPVDETHRDEAEALNETGKTKFRTADLNGALADFQHANQLVADARYVYNICLAYEAQQQWQQAMSSCKDARGMNPRPELVEKIDYRLDLLKTRTSR